ncbi:lysocardiolipin acyltransferase 1-like [Limulus polyphemus]|uniref:Lysocardiolipin acyltransferase 1-like n=1 Tax=Limulus polyphemus TaxID=6850 RepID=A0ABM1B1B3_LIMPO|nr:lysocardiolipin acyltransferase 1-like [Limulus polyphemus]
MYVKNVIFCCLWYGSIFYGFFFFYCPLMPLALLNPPLFHKLTDFIFASWEAYSSALIEIICDVRFVIEGDFVRTEEHSLIVMNHRTRVDWLFFWALLQHRGVPLTTRCKFVLKSFVKHIPALGWVMQMSRFLYIKRSWAKDQILLEGLLHLLNSDRCNLQVLLFPEGTDLTLSNIKKSEAFARRNDFSSYRHVLHPRTTGFVFMAQKMREFGMLDAVYDVTIGYPDRIPQSEVDCLRGNMPKFVHFLVKRYDQDVVPVDEEELSQWCKELWTKKEKTLDRFYLTGRFSGLDPETNTKEHRAEPILNHFYTSFLFWTSFVTLSLMLCATLELCRLWVTSHTFFFICLSFLTQGFEQLEVTYHYYRLKVKQS